MSKEYNFNLKNFEGPLDLLLHLVQKKQIDITNVDVLDLATQYLNFIKEMKEKEFTIASEYLVMASSLLLLKARMVIQDPREKEIVEAQKEQLIGQLIEYQQYKNVRSFLSTKESFRKKMFTKELEDIVRYEKNEDSISSLSGHSSIVVLVSALRKMHERVNATIHGHTRIDFTNISPDEQIEKVRAILEEKIEFNLLTMLNVMDLKHFLATLLAILDMSKNQEIIIEQSNSFGELLVRIRKGELYE